MIEVALGTRPGRQIPNEVIHVALQSVLDGRGVVATAANFNISRRTLTRWMEYIGIRGTTSKRKWKRRGI